MKYWYNENMRMLQTVICEKDMINYDAVAVAEYMKANHMNCLVMSAGGVVDHFPNPLPMKRENRFMQPGQDILKDLCTELHKRGMHIIVRVDFRGVEEERFQEHPDWFAMDIHGKPIYSPMRKTYSPCYNSYYATEHAEEFVEYLMKTYEIDGIWENAATFGQDVCYCERCRQRYMREVGKEIPVFPKVEERQKLAEYMKPEYAEYRAWKAKVADDHIKLMRDTVKSFGEDKAFCAEIFDIYGAGLAHMLISSVDHQTGKRYFDLLVSCVSPDTPIVFSRDFGKGFNSPNVGASIMRFSRALNRKVEPVICTGGNGTGMRYVTAPKLQKRLYMWELASIGGGLWYVYFNGSHPAVTYDRRNAFGQNDVCSFMEKAADKLSGSAPVKDVGIYYSFETRNRMTLGDSSEALFGDAIKGVERVLLEKHIPYGFVIADDDFSIESLKGIKTLIMPNTTVLSEREADIIRQYVADGGGLIATHQTSLLDPDGNRRADYALGDLFGCSFAGETVDTRFDSYYAIKEQNSPLLSGVENTDLILNGGYTAKCRVTTGNAVVNFIPRIPNQPPEHAWRAEMDSEFAGIVCNEYGAGRVVYFANTTDSLCNLFGHEDFTEMLGNAIDYTSREKYTIFVDTYRSVHVNITEKTQDDGSLDHVISFINTTGTAAQPMKELVPVGSFVAELRKNGKKCVASKVLWGDGIRVEDQGDVVRITVDGLHEFKSISVRLHNI